MTGWTASSFSTLVNWFPLASIVSSTDSLGINFLIVASEHEPTRAVSDFRAVHITDSQISSP